MAALTPKARALVKAGRSAFHATDADRQRIDEALRARLGSGALPPDTGGTSRTQLSSNVGWHAVSGVVIGVCVAAGVAFLALRPSAGAPVPQGDVSTPPAASTTPAAPQTPSGQPSTRSPTAVPVPAMPTAAPRVASSSKAPGSPAFRGQDRLAQEVALLSRATSELRAGHTLGALKTLEEHQHRFPSGALTEDRQAAKAQALCSLGRVSAGRAALSNLAPQSPAAARAKQICDSASMKGDLP